MFRLKARSFASLSQCIHVTRSILALSLHDINNVCNVIDIKVLTQLSTLACPPYSTRKITLIVYIIAFDTVDQARAQWSSAQTTGIHLIVVGKLTTHSGQIYNGSSICFSSKQQYILRRRQQARRAERMSGIPYRVQFIAVEELIPRSCVGKECLISDLVFKLRNAAGVRNRGNGAIFCDFSGYRCFCCR